MHLIHQRYSFNLDNNGSSQAILIEKEPYAFFCHIVEDEPRAMDKIVRGETRLPSGLHELKICKELTPKTKLYRGLRGFEWFQFFIEVVSPGKDWLEVNGIRVFDQVFLHNGNFEKETEGCPLLNDSIGNNMIEPVAGARSNQAMKRFYAKYIPILEKPERVFYEVRDEQVLCKP